MRNILGIIFILFGFLAQGQKTWTSKDIAKVEDTDIYFEIGDYKTALRTYKFMYKKYGASRDLEFKIGLCNHYLDEKDTAKVFFERAVESGNPNASYFLGTYFHEEENFDAAEQQFEIFKNMEGNKMFEPSDADRMIEMAERAKRMMANPIVATVYNMGEKVNSPYDDYSPLITADEHMLVFTSRREGSTGDRKDPYGEYLEDIYFAYKDGDKWNGLKNAGPPLNTSTHDASVGLSADGKSMIIYRTNKLLTAGDLYISQEESGDWSEPQMLNEAINTEYQEASASLTNDQQVIYFSSNRPGGYGGKDIYRVVRIGKDIWSLPLNLGPTINTAYDEDAPFIHPDGKTLFFSSKGHKTMGGYDVFKTSLNESYWTTPENLGYPANTVRDDIFFVLTEDGKRGYYSSELDDGYGGYDVYVVSFENDVESLRIVKGNISDEQGKALSAKIDLLNEDGESIGIYSTNSLTGNYIIILPPDQNFSMEVTADNYQSIEEDLFYQGGTNVREKLKNYKLKKNLEQ